MLAMIYRVWILSWYYVFPKVNVYTVYWKHGFREIAVEDKRLYLLLTEANMQDKETFYLVDSMNYNKVHHYKV